ncbi:MAG TPA: oligosaccharide flippase family protein [Thermoleophilaceae bacterium]
MSERAGVGEAAGVGERPGRAERARASDRLPFAASELRSRTIRGVAVNAAFLIVVETLALAQGLIVARLLGPSELGLYGIVSITVMTLIALKRVGIDEAFVQQDERDQEREFQLAFTLELVLAAAFALLIALAAPVLAVVYDESRLVPLTLALAYLPIAFALQAPLWIFFRRMDFLRQRSLQAIVPIVTFVVTVPLAAAGLGAWSIVIGAFAGNAASVTLAVRLSPHRLGLRFDRAAARRYLSFSWPILVVTAGGLLVAQGQVLAFKLDRGLAAAGFVSLAVGLTRYADRAEHVVSPAIYPAICAVRDRTRTLEELFTAAARATAVWSLGFGALLVLFAPDVVDFLLGDEWAGAVVLLQGLGAASALYQLGYSWIAFARGLGRPRPPALEAVAAVTVFGGVALPLLLAAGPTAYVLAICGSSLAVLAIRAYWIPRLLPGVRLGALLARAAWPVAVAAAAPLALRLALWGGERGAVQAACEAVLFVAVYVAVTLAAERPLVGELRRAIRSPGGEPAAAQPA